MTIEKMSEFYQKGYYSKFDFYLGVVQILSQTEDSDPILEKIPPFLIDDVLAMADRHYHSARAHSSFEEAKNPERILLWGSSLSTSRLGSNGTTPENVQGGESRVAGHLDVHVSDDE
jgi:hypothetical protein